MATSHSHNASVAIANPLACLTAVLAGVADGMGVRLSEWACATVGPSL